MCSTHLYPAASLQCGLLPLFLLIFCLSFIINLEAKWVGVGAGERGGREGGRGLINNGESAIGGVGRSWPRPRPFMGRVKVFHVHIYIFSQARTHLRHDARGKLISHYHPSPSSQVVMLRTFEICCFGQNTQWVNWPLTA